MDGANAQFSNIKMQELEGIMWENLNVLFFFYRSTASSSMASASTPNVSSSRSRLYSSRSLPRPTSSSRSNDKSRVGPQQVEKCRFCCCCCCGCCCCCCCCCCCLFYLVAISSFAKKSCCCIPLLFVVVCLLLLLLLLLGDGSQCRITLPVIMANRHNGDFFFQDPS